ncbi:Purple acid phosphatase 17 isoform 2 [Hibiscus syriacus]|uniref:Purple acid phosphatase 17 isoform 2 n=1 Tax=Hibiscus syriacus TaxID=106335 RepID=A0A6A3C3Y0_HIBSY|nr:Purple acid phosphatase 17 isoform 2 [Hibiscus syriacus]
MVPLSFWSPIGADEALLTNPKLLSRGDAEAQLSHLLRKIDSRWLCLRSFIVGVDNPCGHHTFREELLPKTWLMVGADVERALREPSAKWKIYIGHHAITSIGHHGDTPEVSTHLLLILKANDVDFYMNGHDHFLQQISDTERIELRLELIYVGAATDNLKSG